MLTYSCTSTFHISYVQIKHPIYHIYIYIYTYIYTWAEEIRGLMEEKGLMEEDWNDRGNWRKKII